MCQVFEELAEKRVVEEKKASARRLIARGKMTLEEIAEDMDLPLEEVKELAGLQHIFLDSHYIPDCTCQLWNVPYAKQYTQ